MVTVLPSAILTAPASRANRILRRRGRACGPRSNRRRWRSRWRWRGEGASPSLGPRRHSPITRPSRLASKWPGPSLSNPRSPRTMIEVRSQHGRSHLERDSPGHPRVGVIGRERSTPVMRTERLRSHADPVTLEELEAAFARFARPIRGCRLLANLSQGLCDEPYDAGLVVIDLAAALIVVDSTYSSPETRGVVPYHDGRCATDLWVKYHLADDWLISSGPRGGEPGRRSASGTGRETDSGRPRGVLRPAHAGVHREAFAASPGAKRSTPRLVQEGLTDQADRGRPSGRCRSRALRQSVLRHAQADPCGLVAHPGEDLDAPARARSRSSGMTTSRGTCKTVANNGRSPASALLD